MDFQPIEHDWVMNMESGFLDQLILQKTITVNWKEVILLLAWKQQPAS